ncbi:hypothetical protein Nmul_A2051 [Nitrosospira multiformis ATCC 25196]|uniref:Antitoxin Xre/MbcA/ParS-like toxin-binding domain-containing protein n=1 Tax=Nitrosospira multiformis (strain ATCC 25196 / NCIMB 11849 / C 71) TaxID=323848 RepID=Q2Y7C6_NITMU|nr:hypothetical protein Nmul_A2051 [Nitrosospira multiformis ATCC 25196]
MKPSLRRFAMTIRYRSRRCASLMPCRSRCSSSRQTAGVHRNTVCSHPESPKLQHYLREMLRVMSAASASQSDFNRVLFWFKNVPIPSFNHKTALQLIAEGRTDDVVAYLESIQSGYVGSSCPASTRANSIGRTRHDGRSRR